MSISIVKKITTLLPFLLLSAMTFGQEPTKKEKSLDLSSYAKQEGFVDLYFSENTGKLLLAIDKEMSEFLYTSALASGLGSNDIGLDRGQLGSGKVVSWFRSGKRLLLEQKNLRYRAESDNPAEELAVSEAFASAVIASFPIVDETETQWIIDATSFVLSDQHGTAKRVADRKQGSFKLDAKRSAIYPSRCKSFPENTEMEGMLSFAGQAKGQWLRSVSPDGTVFTVRQHHSFVKLPDDNYSPRVYHPKSGFISLEYKDYAQAINKSLERRYIRRHRLEKVNPGDQTSTAIEPIIYYLDPGCPEPIRSALKEGANWWNQAFSAAGFINAFQVKDLPEAADPLDVRYNMIQWVHRSTRGWSYGGSVIDPRTGEIIKGHVSLGSLRVRQDLLIAQGMKAAYGTEDIEDELTEMALARLRQLSAHEVGHTIGLSHNFASSVNDRASVMDYPHPYITMDDSGNIDLSDAYASGIGLWDKQAIKYGYSEFNTAEEQQALQNIVKETRDLGLLYISDRDARDPAGAHPHAHLWDNGKNASVELQRLLLIRQQVLKNLSSSNIPPDQPHSYLQNILIPAYYMHRYQVEACAKSIGGMNYAYSDSGSPAGQTPVYAPEQRIALTSILQSLEPQNLAIDRKLLLDLIPPCPRLQ